VATIREFRPNDEEPIVELALRAWAPIFRSLEELLGAELFTRLHGDWRHYQATSVRRTLADDDVSVWVAERVPRVVGFVAATLQRDRRLGEIVMIAVDPDAQHERVGAALTDWATDWLRRSGMRAAMVETGGDAGHAAARRLYEAAGYQPLPIVRYFKTL
jgi:ribosomal protein S18 acetylase RimI-like enzyme